MFDPTKVIGPLTEAVHTSQRPGGMAGTAAMSAVNCPPLAGTVIEDCPPTVTVPTQKRGQGLPAFWRGHGDHRSWSPIHEEHERCRLDGAHLVSNAVVVL